MPFYWKGMPFGCSSGLASNPTDPLGPERGGLDEGDFGHAPDLQKALRETTAVIHLVCTTRPKSSNDEPIFDVQSNVISTLQLSRQ